MSLVPPEALQAVMIEGPASPLSADDAARLAEMVESGFRAWREFHEKFNAEQQRIRQLDGGLVSWEDVEDFLLKYAGAEAVDGFRAQRFEIVNGESKPVEDVVNVFRLRDGTAYATGDTQGAPVFGPGDESIRQLGLNSPPVAAALRDCAFPKLPTGAAHLRLGPGWTPANLQKGESRGVLVFLVQPVQAKEHAGWLELSPNLACHEVTSAGETRAIDDKERRQLLRALFQSSPRVKPPADDGLVGALLNAGVGIIPGTSPPIRRSDCTRRPSRSHSTVRCRSRRVRLPSHTDRTVYWRNLRIFS